MFIAIKKFVKGRLFISIYHKSHQEYHLYRLLNCNVGKICKQQQKTQNAAILRAF